MYSPKSRCGQGRVGGGSEVLICQVGKPSKRGTVQPVHAFNTVPGKQAAWKSWREFRDPSCAKHIMALN